jgi:hypothetical protein
LTIDGIERTLNLSDAKCEQIFDFFVRQVGINNEDKRRALFITPRFYAPSKSNGDGLSVQDIQSTAVATAGTQELEDADDMDVAETSQSTQMRKYKKRGRGYKLPM